MTIYLLIGAVLFLWCLVLDSGRDNMSFDDAHIPAFVICAWPVFLYVIILGTIVEFE